MQGVTLTFPPDPLSYVLHFLPLPRGRLPKLSVILQFKDIHITLLLNASQFSTQLRWRNLLFSLVKEMDFFQP